MRKQKHKCIDCEKTFLNAGALGRHRSCLHPYIPPPEPKQTVITSPNDIPETITLIGTDNKELDVGDVFYHIRKFVITKIVRTEGIDQSVVTVLCTKRNWSLIQPNQPPTL